MGGASDFVLCGVVLGGALGLDCIWNLGVGFGRCFVYWIVFGISAWDLGGALRLAGLKS